MKLLYKNILSVALLSGAIMLAGCHKDESTEGLLELNKVDLSDPKTGAVISVFQGERLNLKPTLSQSMKNNMDDLSFNWSVYDNSPTSTYVTPRSTISEDYELNYVIDGETFTLGQNYLLRLTVTEKSTGLSSFLNYRLLIANKYGTGWVVLEDKAGKGDLSFVFPDNTVEHGIYTDRNTTVLTNPRKIEIVPFSITDDISASGKRMYILADGGSQEYNFLTMVKKFDYSFLFFSAPPVIKPTVMNFTSGDINSANRGAILGIAINNGKAHSNLVGGFPGVKKWGDIALTPNGTQNYNLAPFASGGATYPAVVYDNTSKRFFYIRGYSPTPVAGSLEAFPSAASSVDAFDMNNVGMTMLFQDSADVVKTINAVMKSDDNQLYLLKYKTESVSSAPIITLSKTLMNAPGFLNYTAAAGSTSTPHIYYGTANRIIKYETSSNTPVDAYTFAAGEQVTAIKYAKYSSDRSGPRLVVATWNGTEGKVYFFTINAVGDIGSFTNTFGGFSKIVDLAYKY